MAEKLPVARVLETKNDDIASLIRRVDRTLVEVTKSQSSGVTGVMPFDFVRLEAQQASWLDYANNYAAKQPYADRPETTPIIIRVELFGTVPPIENDTLWDVAQMLDSMILELANSQSSNIGNGFLPPHDLKRFNDLNTRLSTLIAFSKKMEPNDYPESSPLANSTGAGVTGISYTDDSKGSTR